MRPAFYFSNPIRTKTKKKRLAERRKLKQLKNYGNFKQRIIYQS